MNTPSRNRSGFTLIELLTVIAIIGILAAVLFPGVQGVMKAAKKSSAQTKLTNIAKAYVNFNNSGSGGKIIRDDASWSATNNTKATSIADYAAVLAFNVDLNEAEIWYVEADIANESATFQKQILVGEGASRTINGKFATGSSADGYISWSAYTPTIRNIGSTTPLLWARGLTEAGAWADTGVWGTEGGHIAFGDAHVIWAANTTDEETKFVSRKTAGSMTQNWKEAISKEGTFTERSSK